MTETLLKILMVEDNPSDAFLLHEELKRVKKPTLELTHVELLEEAIERLNRESFDVILLDLSLPDSVELSGLMRLQDKTPSIPIVVLTGLEDENLAAKAVREGAQDYLVKGQTNQQLLVRAMRYAIERKKFIKEQQKLNRCLSILSNTNHALVRAKEEDDFLQNICNLLVEKGKYPLVWIGFAQNNLAKTVRVVTHAGDDGGHLKKIKITWDESPAGRGASGLSINTGKHQVFRNVSTHPDLAPWKSQCQQFNFSSMISLPLSVKNKVIGNLAILSADANAFDQDEIDLLLELADDLSYGIETLRTRAENQRNHKALQETNGLLEKIFASTHLLIAYMDRNYNYLRVNDTFAKIDNQTPDFYIGKNHFELFPNEEIIKIYRRVVETGEPYYAVEKPFAYAHGPEQGLSYWDWSLLPVKESDGSVTGLVLSLFDVSKRKHLEKEILEISRREQRRIGQDLHDVLGQNLTGLAFLAKVLERKLSQKSLAETKEASKIANLANQAVNQTRALARGLCPVDIKADGLMNALQDFAFNLENIFGVSCHFQCKTPILIHDNLVAVNLYHIAQEAVNNAVKHSKAEDIVIELSNDNDLVTLTIQDNGSGLQCDEKTSSKSMGLRIMDYRARMIGASFTIENRNPQGAIVTCTFRNIPQNTSGDT